MPSAGELKHRVRFEQRAPNARGERLGPWTEVATEAAKLLFLRGTEAVMAQRLQGKRPVVITVRASAKTRQISTPLQGVNVRTGEVYAIKAVTPDDTGAWIDILAEAKSG